MKDTGMGASVAEHAGLSSGTNTRTLMGELTGEQRERVLGALRAGSRQGTMGTLGAHSLVRKSPFLSLALLEEFLPQAKQAAQQEMARAKARVMAIGSFEQRPKDALSPKKRSKGAP